MKLSVNREHGAASRRERGATAVEYALMVGLIGMGIIGATSTMRTKISSTFDSVRTGGENVALAGSASQSSTRYANSTADRGNDGNRFSDFYASNPVGAIVHTNANPNEWWQVALAKSYKVQGVTIYNRTDGGAERLSNAWVMVSPTPFPASISTAIADSTISKVQLGDMTGQYVVSAPVSGTGQYVRVWLSDANYLNVGEVEVYA